MLPPWVSHTAAEGCLCALASEADGPLTKPQYLTRLGLRPGWFVAARVLLCIKYRVQNTVCLTIVLFFYTFILKFGI